MRPEFAKTRSSIGNRMHPKRSPLQWAIATAILWAALSAQAPAPRADVAVIPLDHARPGDILPAVEMLLTASGKVSVAPRTHSLVVVDQPEAIDQIRALIRQLDQPTPEVFVRIRFDSKEHGDGRAVEAQGRVSGSGVSVGNRRRDGLDVTVQSRRSGSSEQGEQRVRVGSGSAAYIAVGKTAVHNRSWRQWCRRYPICPDIAVEQRMHTGFWVTPRVRGRQAILRLSPRLTGTPPPGQQPVESTIIDTEVTVPLGRWVDIGGVLRENNEVSAAILQQNDGHTHRAVHMWVRVDPAE